MPAGAATVKVNAGGDLQAAINAAVPGDVIELQAGAVFKGSYSLPVKSGGGYVTIRTSAWGHLPWGRIRPANKPLLATIMAPNGGLPALRTTRGAHHYRFLGIEFRVPAGAYTFGVITIGDGSETSVSQLPSHIEFDRVYVHGDPGAGGKRGIALNGRNIIIQNSYFADFKSSFQDAQAICGWNGAGPFRILNNYLEATGENILFGGAKAAIAGLVPTGIEIRRNHFFKPLTWKPGGSTYAGHYYIVKNHFELKNARNVVVSANRFENLWLHSQGGTSVVLHGDADGPTTTIENITFEKNLFRNCRQGFGIIASHTNQSTPTNSITIRNNLFEGIAGWWLTLIGGVRDVVVEHNTALSGDRILYVGETNAIGKNPGFVFRNNIVARGNHGVGGIGTAEGIASLNRFFPGWIFDRNVVIGAKASIYPPSTFCPATLAEVGFVDAAGGNYRLGLTSAYRRAGANGSDLGANIDAIEAATRQ
jgi:hypothetical protein